MTDHDGRPRTVSPSEVRNTVMSFEGSIDRRPATLASKSRVAAEEGFRIDRFQRRSGPDQLARMCLCSRDWCDWARTKRDRNLEPE